MSRYKCIIFDCDGVLVDSEPLGNQVLVDLANKLGANITLDYAFKNFKGNSLQNCVAQIANLIDTEVPTNFIDQYRKLSYEKFKNEIKPVEGVFDVVSNLKIPFCVASSGPETKIKLNLKLTGLLPYFEKNIFSCYTIQKWKPDPAIFLWAAKAMGFQPTECLVIEDSIIGVNAAVSGGFDVFGFTAHDYNDELKDKATNTFGEMLILPKLIDSKS
ncbi:HAD family hydrolase [Winogradskyella sp. R77965]|uniref:HAD family hydrolase n=1 Tax=Winogradskyella sp. R77965 TaxID=3093872 RepID=UPI0037DC1448